MDAHFGKYKFKSGNIPFTLFGTFDDKTNVLFKDTTDSLKTEFEIVHKSKFERNSEEFYKKIRFQDPVECSLGNNLRKFNFLILSFLVFITKIIF